MLVTRHVTVAIAFHSIHRR